GIDTTLLPQTFRDAIHTTIQLGINYLWIDFLCIVQDNPDDWLRESNVRGQVYQNGYCNIAATKSTATDNGFLTQKSSDIQSLKAACYIQSAWDDEENFHWILHDVNDLDDLLSGPLLNRGWVVQERLIAPKILHFVSKQLYWECHQRDACEGVPSRSLVLPETSETDIKHRHRSLLACSDFSDTMILWAGIVSLYSECQLTMEKDKLVALSGVAKTIRKRHLDGQYLAGSWSDDLGSQLWWSTTVRTRTRPQAYRAPSWSWASIDGIV
ncbi:hypothetical protein BDZ45DRAFT_564472, partial [Acephala macrosclerotiorum]